MSDQGGQVMLIITSQNKIYIPSILCLWSSFTPCYYEKLHNYIPSNACIPSTLVGVSDTSVSEKHQCCTIHYLEYFRLQNVIWS
ncbi:hypothetical protein GYH30_056408 [Glycine max]|nr:hypothetical protein JHK86_056736 [Glycine max]KAH1036981.1 hypothetical protein GYH30_056408 [Glycine max]